MKSNNTTPALLSKDRKSHIHVVFATPTLDHRVACEFFGSSLQTEWLLARHGISTTYRQVAGDQFIAKARNRLVSEFLDDFRMATDLFFLDDDIGWPADKVLEFLRRPEAVVCGAYPKKEETVSYPVSLETQNEKLIKRDGLFSALLAPAGFMRVKRHVLERLAKGARRYMEPNKGGALGNRYNIFEAGLLPHWTEWSGEDYDFCQKVRELGERIWVDPDITFTHRGNKMWTGNFGESVKSYIAKHEIEVTSEILTELPGHEPDLFAGKEQDSQRTKEGADA